MGKTMDVLASIIFPNCTCRDDVNLMYAIEKKTIT